jgi:hypothetical protein
MKPPKRKDNSYLIWSNEHKAWWGPQRSGYVARVEDAGCYNYTAALEICFGAMAGRQGREPLRELPVRLEDVAYMLKRFTQTYPEHDPEPKEM